MRGARCKALRREFKREHGRLPEAMVAKRTGSWKGVLGRWFTMKVVVPSEWRRVKRDWKRRR